MTQHTNNLDLHKALAERLSLPFVTIDEFNADATLLNPAHRDDYFNLQMLPLAVHDRIVKIVTSSLTDQVRAWAAKNFAGYEPQFVITSPFDINWFLQKHFAANDDEAARFALSKKMPQYSASRLFNNKIYPVALIGAIFGLFIYSPAIFGLVLNLACFATLTYKLVAFVLGRSAQPKQAQIEFLHLPIYTILLPLYKEEKSIKRLIAAIDNLDYPRDKLDVKLVIEDDDEITLNAIKQARPPQYMEVIKVPPSLPRTKPKACNYAVQYARGEFITIFDAEDDPEPQQLKKALAAFANPQTACVQARLNYYNAGKNQLTRWFAIEYATWFNVVLKGLEFMRAPLPLGGTSNHIRTSVLKQIGGWDAFNVTEDADLGFRLEALGYGCKTIDSVTMEEAVSKLWPWIKQRTRWLKGFAQTYIVHMRHIKKFKPDAILALQFFIGLPFAIYLALPIWFASSFFTHTPTLLYAFAVFNFAYGALAHIYMSMVASKCILSSLTFPLYGVLHVFAAYRALWQLIFEPHYWDKTEHGN